MAGSSAPIHRYRVLCSLITIRNNLEPGSCEIFFPSDLNVLMETTFGIIVDLYCAAAAVALTYF